jgi:hypothetical protein
MKNLKHQTVILRSLNELQHLIQELAANILDPEDKEFWNKSDSIDEISDSIDAIASCISNSIREEHATESKEETACAEDRILEEEQKRFQQNYDHEKLYQMMQYHLDSVKQSTGEVTIEDYEYCHNLLERIRAYQSSQNPG